jgi:rhodanese-related sulfurtransferase
MLDVREDFEWAAGHVDGAHHVPGNQLPERLGELAQDRPVVVVCRSGHRSALAADYLNRVGLDAHNLGGGLVRWVRAGLPLTAPDGRPGLIA